MLPGRTTTVSRVAHVRAATAVRSSRQASTTASPTHMQASSTTGEAAQQQTLTGGVEVAEISGKRLFVEFAAFGFFKRNCQLELIANGDCIFSKGMVAPENGAWRIEVYHISYHTAFSECRLVLLKAWLRWSSFFLLPLLFLSLLLVVRFLSRVRLTFDVRKSYCWWCFAF